MNSRPTRIVYDTIMTAALMIFTAIIIIPFLWMILLSFKTNASILTDPYGLPNALRFDNYVKLFTDPSIRFQRYIVNSVIVSVGGILLTLVLSSLGGYGFARKRYAFRFRELLFGIFLFSLMLPVQATYIPQFVLMSRYGLINTRLSLILLYTAYQITVSTYLLRTYYAQLPEELEESARIDGAGDMLIFLRIMMPLTKPVMASVTLLNFLYNWNELLLALTMVTTPALRTLPVAMMNFVGESASNYAMAAAALVVGMLPLLVLYLFFADSFVKGLTAGAVKG